MSGAAALVPPLAFALEQEVHWPKQEVGLKEVIVAHANAARRIKRTKENESLEKRFFVFQKKTITKHNKKC